MPALPAATTPPAPVAASNLGDVAQPDVVSGGPRRPYGPRRKVAVVAGAVVAAVALTAAALAAHHRSGPAFREGLVPFPGPIRPAAPPDVLLRAGSQILEVAPGAAAAVPVARLPGRVAGVWATTVRPASSATAAKPASSTRVARVFAAVAGRGKEWDISLGGVTSSDLGPASAVLAMQDQPVLEHAGDPASLSLPSGMSAAGGVQRVVLPQGWALARPQDGLSAVVTRPAPDAASDGVVQIAQWSPRGIVLPLADAGRLVGVTARGEVLWLDPSCPAVSGCRMFFADIGGVYPPAGLAAPPGAAFEPGATMAYGPGGYAALTARLTSGDRATSSTGIVVVEPWLSRIAVASGSESVDAGAGMFWMDGERLLYVATAGSTRRLVLYDVATGASTAFGPPLPAGVRLLTSFGATDGVSVSP